MNMFCLLTPTFKCFRFAGFTMISSCDRSQVVFHMRFYMMQPNIFMVPHEYNKQNFKKPHPHKTSPAADWTPIVNIIELAPH